VKPPLGSADRIKDESPTAFGAGADSLRYQRMAACRMWAEGTWHPCSLAQLAGATSLRGTEERINIFKWRVVIAVRA